MLLNPTRTRGLAVRPLTFVGRAVASACLVGDLGWTWIHPGGRITRVKEVWWDPDVNEWMCLGVELLLIRAVRRTPGNPRSYIWEDTGHVGKVHTDMARDLTRVCPDWLSDWMVDEGNRPLYIKISSLYASLGNPLSPPKSLTLPGREKNPGLNPQGFAHRYVTADRKYIT